MRDAFIKVPFAEGGDKTPIPNATQPDGSISMQQGWGVDYEKEIGVDPAAKPVGRQQMNQILNITTALLNRWQTESFPEWIDSDANGGTPYQYQKGVIVRFPVDSGFVLRYSLVDNNQNTPSGASPTQYWGDPSIAFSGNLVPKTSDTGAAIIPEGTTAQRPLNPSEIPAVGLLFRGNVTTGRPEFFNRSTSGWDKIGTAASLDATVGNQDSTPGRAIKVGDFGFGRSMVAKQGVLGDDAFGSYYDSTKPASFIFNLPYAEGTAGFSISNTPYEDRFFAQSAIEASNSGLKNPVELWHSGNLDVNNIFGFGQSWKDITSSINVNVAYTNTSSKPILIQIIGKSTSSSSQIELLLSGAWVSFAEQGSFTGQTSTTLIPPGVSYRLSAVPFRVMEFS